MTEKVFGTELNGSMNVSIGIDQSLTGFAVTILDVDNPNNYLTWVYKSPFRGVKRLVNISSWLVGKLELVEDRYVVDVAMEGTVLASHSALVLGELAAVVKIVFWSFFEDWDHQTHLRVPLQIPPMTLKKYAAGKGNAKKQEMLMQIYKRYGVEFNDDNAADSYGLARMAGKLHINDVEAQIIEQIKDPKYRDSL
jgi:Holliday junction resolvasome RuvABC endonuclease subunit